MSNSSVASAPDDPQGMHALRGMDVTSTPARDIPVGQVSGLWIPIRAKITIPFLLISLAMSVGMAFVLYQVAFENIDQRFNTQLVASGQLASEWMVQEENQSLDTLRMLAYTTGVGDDLAAASSIQLRADTWGLVVGHQVDDVEFLDGQGKLVLSMRHRLGSQSVEDYLFSSGGDFNYSQYPFVRAVLDRQVDSKGDKYSGLARASWGDYFYVSGPVYTGAGNFAGVVLVGTSMTDLARSMSQDILAQVTFYDLSGTAIASTYSVPALQAGEVHTVITDQANSSLRRDGSGQRNLTFSHITYAEILGSWKLRGETAGIIGVAIPKNFLVQTSDSTRIQIAILIGLGLFMVLIAGGMIASYITRPLLKLVTASK